MSLGIAASGYAECSIKHHCTAHSKVKDAVGNLQIQGVEVDITAAAVSFQREFDRRSHGCQRRIECLVVTSGQCCPDVNVCVRQPVQTGGESGIGTQAPGFKVTGWGGEYKTGKVCAVSADIHRSFGSVEHEAGLFGKGEFPYDDRYCILIQRFQRQIGGQAVHSDMVHVENAVSPFGAAHIIAYGTVPDKHGVGP